MNNTVQEVLHNPKFGKFTAVVFQWYVWLIVGGIFFVLITSYYFVHWEIDKFDWLDPAAYNASLYSNIVKNTSGAAIPIDELYIHPILRCIVLGAPIACFLGACVVTIHAISVIRLSVLDAINCGHPHPFQGYSPAQGIRLTILLPLFYIVMAANGLNRTLEVFTFLGTRSVLFIAKKSLNIATLFQCLALGRFLLLVAQALATPPPQHKLSKDAGKYYVYVFRVLVAAWLYIIFAVVYFCVQTYEAMLVIWEYYLTGDHQAGSQEATISIMKWMHMYLPMLGNLSSSWWNDNVLQPMTKLNAVFTITCVINVMFLCQHKRIKQIPFLGASAGLKFNAIRMLVFLGAVQPLFIEKITRITFIRFATKPIFGDWHPSDAQGWLIHISLLCWECFFLAIVNVVAWPPRVAGRDRKHLLEWEEDCDFCRSHRHGGRVEYEPKAWKIWHETWQDLRRHHHSDLVVDTSYRPMPPPDPV